MKWSIWLWPVIFTLLANTTWANSPTGQLKQLAHSPAWQSLLYYKKSWRGAMLSEIDDDRFFFAKDGNRSPLNELKATIKAFNTRPKNGPLPQCNFPARYQWIKSQIPQYLKTAPVQCHQLQRWKSKINANAATLIFPSAYLDSPSSMFGHTLLRLDQPNQTKNNEILAYTVNYAATKAPGDSELGFVYRGLVGGYPGDVTILPYYMKLKEYKDMESRDIWEYKLNLTEKETNFLLDVIWEVKDKRINYFFFTENCSYRIVSFLNAVRPEHKLLSQFPLSAIPLDTVRVLKQAGFISAVHYRPSVRTVFNNTINQLSRAEKAWVYHWASGDLAFDADKLPSTQNGAAALLDAAFQYSRMASNSTVDMRKLSYELLSARKNYRDGSNLKPVSRPSLSDEHGHHSRAASLAAGSAYQQNYLGLTLRAAYHDILDPPLGYPEGATLKFGEIDIRYYEQDQLSVERADLVAIASIKPRDTFFKPMSWMVQLGGQRYQYRSKRIFATGVKGMVGPSYYLGSGHYFYSMAGADVRAAGAYDNGHNMYLVGEAGLLGRTSGGVWQLKLEALGPILSAHDNVVKATGKYAHTLAANTNLSVTVGRSYLAKNYETSFTLALGVFF